MDAENIGKMKDLVRNFRREVTKLNAKEGKCDSVYHCSMATFPIYTAEKDVNKYFNSSPNLNSH
jgi:hypothetical protein